MADNQTVNDEQVVTSEVTEDVTSEAPTNEGTTEEKSSEQPKEPSVKEDDLGVVKDEEGREYIPKEAFDKRLSSEVGKRKEAQELLESLRNDPDIRQQFLETIKETEKETTPTKEKIVDVPETSAWKKFVATYPEDQRDGLVTFAQALSSEIEPYVQAKINEAVAPLVSAYGKTELDTFLQKVPEAKNYLPQMHSYMKKHPTVSHIDAYKQVAFDDMFKKGKAVQKKESQIRQQKILKTPVTKEGNAAIVKSKANKSIEDGIAEALDEAGFK